MKKLLLLIVFFALVKSNTAQDLHFSQMYETPILRNPAITGLFTGQYRFRTIFRNQWQSIRGVDNTNSPYRTIGAAGEVKVKGYCIDDETLVIGFQFLNDWAGDGRLTRNMAQVSLGYRLPLSDALQLSGGFYGGPVFSSYKWGRLRWDDQYVDNRYSSTTPTMEPYTVSGKNYWDMGLGIALSNVSYNGYSWYVGAGWHHLNNPRIAFTNDGSSPYRLPYRYAINAGYSYTFENLDELIFCSDFMRQGGQQQVLTGVFYRMRFHPDTDVPDQGLVLSMGCLWRVNDALVPVVNINLDKWALGLSYDVTTSPLSRSPNIQGAWEVSLKFRGLTNNREDACGHIGCPTPGY